MLEHPPPPPPGHTNAVQKNKHTKLQYILPASKAFLVMLSPSESVTMCTYVKLLMTYVHTCKGQSKHTGGEKREERSG